MKYGGKELAEYDLWALTDILAKLTAAEQRREEASKNHKFDKVNNKKAMEFPPPNPEFLKLKDEVETLIKGMQGSNNE